MTRDTTLRRIGLVCPYSWDAPGGVQSHVRDLARALQQRGYQVSVLAPGDEEPEEDFVEVVGRAVPIRYNGSVARLAFGPISTQRVRRWIVQGEFDLLHIHEPVAPSISLVACWAADGPMVGTFHMSSEGGLRVRALSKRILATALEKLRGGIAVSNKALVTMRENHPMSLSAVVIPNGVDVAALRHAQPHSKEPGTVTIGFLGRIDEPRKGFSVLAEAMPQILARCPNAQFLIAGPGEASEVLAVLPKTIHERVRFLGRVDEPTKAAMLATCDVFVAPNTGGESFGIILLEAMAAGAPVVASDIAAFADVLDGGTCGELFTAGDATSLAAAVTRLLTDPQRAEQLRTAAHDRVETFAWPRVVDQIIEVYESARTPGERVVEDVAGTALGRMTKVVRGDDR